MKTTYRTLALLGAAILLMLGLAACGGLSGNAVVSIGGDEIKKDQFDHLMPIAAKQSGQVPGANTAVPDPPDFKKCIAAAKKAAAKPAKGQPRPSEATFKQQCKTQYMNLSDQVMQYLVRAAWIQGEAQDRDITVTDKEVKKQFDIDRKQNFPTVEAYNEFLKTSGYKTEDLLFQVKSKMLSERLQKQIMKGKDKASDAEIAEYYKKNQKNFSQPEQRSLLVVMTKTKAQAEKAKAELVAGAAWNAVAKKYSIDVTSKGNGGKLENVPEGQQEPTLDKATFSAKRNTIVGPVKTQFGYYVFKVTKIQKATQQELKDVKDTVKQTLISEKQQKAMQDFSKEFEKKWKARTECRKGYITEQCSNAPKPKKGESTTVQQAPPQ
jgi:foldase protein PrsA